MTEAIPLGYDDPAKLCARPVYVRVLCVCVCLCVCVYVCVGMTNREKRMGQN